MAFIFNQKFFQDLREATGLSWLHSPPLLFVCVTVMMQFKNFGYYIKHKTCAFVVVVVVTGNCKIWRSKRKQLMPKIKVIGQIICALIIVKNWSAHSIKILRFDAKLATVCR